MVEVTVSSTRRARRRAGETRSVPDRPRDYSDPYATGLYFPKIRRRRSKLHGWGVFALEKINKNKRIIHYAGEKIRVRDSLVREDRYLMRGEIWCFRINRLFVRDAYVGGNLARFINHACKPNCYATVRGDTIWIVAARTIEAGEELSLHYNTEGDGEIPCRCRPGCPYRL
jgi:SET domain-containing protein